MPNQVRVEIGGIGFLFLYKRSEIAIGHNNGSYIRHFVKAGKADFIIDVGLGEPPAYTNANKLFQSKENWCLYGDDMEWIFETYWPNGKENKVIGEVCFLKKNRLRSKLYISPNLCSVKQNKTRSLEDLMRIAGQLIAISILPHYQAALIHSLGIILNGEGILFSGVSTAGKTTLAKLWQKRNNVTILNDDRVIVREEKKGYFVYGTPWPGEGNTVSHKKAPLKKILFLSKAKENKLLPIEKKEAFQKIMTQCFPAIWDRDNVDFILQFNESLVKHTPCFSFGFVPDESALDFIENKIDD